MEFTLTGINFTYANGYDSPYTGVRLNFSASGTDGNISGAVNATNNEYTTAGGDNAKLIALVKQKIIDSLGNV